MLWKIFYFRNGIIIIEIFQIIIRYLNKNLDILYYIYDELIFFYFVLYFLMSVIYENKIQVQRVSDKENYYRIYIYWKYLKNIKWGFLVLFKYILEVRYK